MDEEEPIISDFDEIIVCPECGHEQVIEVTPSVNVTLDPEMRDKVLSGEIFQFTCEKCGFSGFAGFPMIYEDKETNGGFLVYLEPDCPDRVVGIDGDVADKVLLNSITMRLVTTFNELKEKIFAFEAGIDDRVLELFKVLALSNMEASEDQAKPDELRFIQITEKDGEKTISLAAFREEQYLGVLDMPYSLYQSCVITGEPIWDYPVFECGMVDAQWIHERLQADRESAAEDGCSDECCSTCGHHCGGNDTHET